MADQRVFRDVGARAGVMGTGQLEQQMRMPWASLNLGHHKTVVQQLMSLMRPVLFLYIVSFLPPVGQRYIPIVPNFLVYKLLTRGGAVLNATP